jgi:cytochrome c-type biogenesis protein
MLAERITADRAPWKRTMGVDVTLAGAVLAGLISFLSPCVLPLVPPYLCFLAGMTLDELTASREVAARRRVVISSLAFVAGFSAVFIGLGATASVFGQFVQSLFGYTITIFGWAFSLVSVVAGAIIITVGLHFLGVFRFALLDREARFQVRRQPAGPFGAFWVGIAFGFGWTPCIGPVLGTILVVAGSEETVGRGALLLAGYSAGLGVPFLLAGLFAGQFMGFLKRFRGYFRTVERTLGAVMVAVGVLFITGQMTALSLWLWETFPGLANFG